MSSSEAVYWAEGELTGSELVLGTDGQIVDRIVSHLAEETPPEGYTRAELLLSSASAIAAELQHRLLAHAIDIGSFDPATATAATLKRLIAPKVVEEDGGPWAEQAVPLVVVRDGRPFKRPEGAVIVISATGDTPLILSLVRAGWLSAGIIQLGALDPPL